MYDRCVITAFYGSSTVSTEMLCPFLDAVEYAEERYKRADQILVETYPIVWRK